MKKCLKCKKLFMEPPAISRINKKFGICPLCGTEEALDAAGITEGSSLRKMVLEEVAKNMKPCYSAGKKIKSARKEVSDMKS